METPIILAAMTAINIGCTVVMINRARAAKRYRDAGRKAIRLATDAAEQMTGMLLSAPRVPGRQVIGTESVRAKEFFDALNAADLPTPGCGCGECDARRLRQAAKQAGR